MELERNIDVMLFDDARDAIRKANNITATISSPLNESINIAVTDKASVKNEVLIPFNFMNS
ncbi:TPA: hypothetical protein I3292_002724 [Enterobacter cloacae subsp. cloacae]|nr:hypothetical protein [Enterobacter cloacae subsp. cloacae]